MSHISIFDIYPIVENIAFHLRPYAIEQCRQVTRSWNDSFTLFRRAVATWTVPLTLLEQANLLHLAPKFWSLEVDLYDRTFECLIESDQLKNVRELICCGNARHYRHKPYGFPSKEQLSDPSIYSPVVLDQNTTAKSNEILPAKIQRLLLTMASLSRMVIRFNALSAYSDCSTFQFSAEMLQTVETHRTLTTIEIDFGGRIQWPGLKSLFESLPESIEIFKLYAGTVNSGNFESKKKTSFGPTVAEMEEAVSNFARKDPYPRLKSFGWSVQYEPMVITTLILPILRLCPRLERLDLPKIPWTLEREVVRALQAHCRRVLDLNLAYWESIDKIRVIQSLALQSLRIAEIYWDPKHVYKTNYYAVVPSLSVLSRDSLLALDLRSTCHWTPHHDIGYLLQTFPNLQELSVDWYSFFQNDIAASASTSNDISASRNSISDSDGSQKHSVSVLSWPTSTRLKKLHVEIHQTIDTLYHFLQGETPPVTPSPSALPPPPPPPPPQPSAQVTPVQNRYDDDDDYHDNGSHHYYDDSDWEPTNEDYEPSIVSSSSEEEYEPEELDISIPYSSPENAGTCKTPSVGLAPYLLRLYDNLAGLSNLQDLNLKWRFADHKFPFAFSDICEGFRMNIHGPCFKALIDQGIRRGDLQRMNLEWIEGERKGPEKWVDPDLQRRGFILVQLPEEMIQERARQWTDREWRGRGGRGSGRGQRWMTPEEYRTQKILQVREQIRLKIEAEERERIEEEERDGREIEYLSYKSRNRHRKEATTNKKLLRMVNSENQSQEQAGGMRVQRGLVRWSRGAWKQKGQAKSRFL
ncbi:hypothetical protein BGZ83_000755 [Gryganskiella cystojenkinii]|nr:hypothetical protein BGZ83_000755 [Gryganskiella cystojenkinii]